jgi:hypothetical protein
VKLTYTSALFSYKTTMWIFFSMALPAYSGPRPLIQFLNHFSQTVGLLGRMISPSQGRYLNTGQDKHRINTYTHQTSIPWVGFEPTIPTSERAKTVHDLDRAATVIGAMWVWLYNKIMQTARRSHTKSWKCKCSQHETRRNPTQKYRKLKLGGGDVHNRSRV